MDVEAGRVIIEGVEYDFSRIAAVDHERRIIYVVDAVEPLGVMALSIEDGSRIAIYGGTRGDGPGELRSLRSVSLSPEGVLVSGGGAINHWGREGNFIGSWRPDLSAASRVVGQCMVHGELVVPSMMGAVRRKSDGSWELLGRRPGGNVGADIFGATRVACVPVWRRNRTAGCGPSTVCPGRGCRGEDRSGDRMLRDHQIARPGHPTNACVDRNVPGQRSSGRKRGGRAGHQRRANAGHVSWSGENHAAPTASGRWYAVPGQVLRLGGRRRFCRDNPEGPARSN